MEGRSNLLNIYVVIKYQQISCAPFAIARVLHCVRNDGATNQKNTARRRHQTKTYSSSKQPDKTPGSQHPIDTAAPQVSHSYKRSSRYWNTQSQPHNSQERPHVCNPSAESFHLHFLMLHRYAMLRPAQSVRLRQGQRNLKFS